MRFYCLVTWLLAQNTALITTRTRISMLVRGMLLLGWFIWRCSDLVLCGRVTDAQHAIGTSAEFTSVVAELRIFFYKGFYHRLQRIVCYVKETAVDGMFSLQISHIQKFAWPFFGHVILFDKVRCSHIKKKFRLAKNSVFFELWLFCVPKDSISSTSCKFGE